MQLVVVIPTLLKHLLLIHPVELQNKTEGHLIRTEDADNPDHCGYTHCFSFQDYAPGSYL